MQNYLDELNEYQKKAVEHTEGPLLIIAGAGSGKTRVLTYRIAHLLKNGKRPSRILALTFTNKAAREMKDRVAAIVGVDTANYLWMGTFHSIFARILRAESAHLGYPSNFTIYDTADSKSLLKKVIKDLNLDDKVYKPGNILARISNAKNNLITVNAYLSNSSILSSDRSSNRAETGNIYKLYSERCKRAGAMDFDDLLLQTNILFRDSPQVLEKYQNRFDYVLVDEYQDTNNSQYHIIKKISEKHKNICAVGDDSQSIYSFRGAKIENILNFQRDYSDNKLIKLEQNYRSTQNIVDAANSLIAKNENRIPKEIFSENEIGGKIGIFQNINDNEEGYFVANSIINLRMKEQHEYKNFAILYRTNAQSRIFEEALRRRNIPYKIYGGLSFYQRKEIKDLLSYFRLMVNPRDNEALKRIINYPKRGIGATTVECLETAAEKAKRSMWEVILDLDKIEIGLKKAAIKKIFEFAGLITSFAKKTPTTNAYELAKQVASESGILKDLYVLKEAESLSRHENIQEILNGIKEFASQQDIEPNELTLDKYLEDVALLTNDDNEKEEDRNKVILMTVHSSKGLEFKNVYVVGLEENLFPSQMSAMMPKGLEEERRLFYVAITRAEQNLFLSFAKSRSKWGNFVDSIPSRFISEIDGKFLNLPSSFDSENVRFETAGSKQKLKQRYNFTKTTSQPPKTENKTVKHSGLRRRSIARQAQQNQVANSSFKADPPSKIVAGVNVEHQRFGYGKVVLVEGDAVNKKATIKFQKVGVKLLLLKFAKLRVVNENN